jgi:hypothetical protein
VFVDLEVTAGPRRSFRSSGRSLSEHKIKIYLKVPEFEILYLYFL